MLTTYGKSDNPNLDYGSNRTHIGHRRSSCNYSEQHNYVTGEDALPVQTAGKFRLILGYSCQSTLPVYSTLGRWRRHMCAANFRKIRDKI